MHSRDSRRRVYIVEHIPLKDKTKSESPHVLLSPDKKSDGS